MLVFVFVLIYCFTCICICIGGYEIYKDPVARQKRQLQIDNKLKKGMCVNVCIISDLHLCA